MNHLEVLPRAEAKLSILLIEFMLLNALTLEKPYVDEKMLHNFFTYHFFKITKNKRYRKNLYLFLFILSHIKIIEIYL